MTAPLLRRSWTAPAAAALAAAAVHVPFLAADPFFFADDFGCLADVDNLSRGSAAFFSLPPWGVWRLGHRAFLWLEYALFGLRPLPYHLANVALHAAVAALVCRLARTLGAPPWRAAAAAAVFATWAFPSMTVRYPAVSAPMLAALAVLGALLAWRGGRPWLAAALTLAGAAVYEQALAAPVAMLALGLLRFRDRIRTALPSLVAAALFVAVNVWTLRGTTKVFAYNAGGIGALRQLLLAPGLVLDVPVPWRQGWALAAVPVALLALALAWRPARPLLLGLALAWSAALPLAGRAGAWPEWYLYLTSAGVALALGLAAPHRRAWTAALLGLAAVNVGQQQVHARGFAWYTERYREVTLATPVAPRPAAMVLVNVHSGLAWTGWQFGDVVPRFELWDSATPRAACFRGASLEEAAAAARLSFPDARRRMTYPDDLPPGLRAARPPLRHHLFDWPADGRVPPALTSAASPR